MPQPRIYLDHAATTPLVPAAREAMAEALERWANPSSPHAEGRAAKAALEHARARIAAALGWTGRVVFTSGASEALAIALGRGRNGPLYVSAIEHDAVLRAAPHAVTLAISGGIADVAAVAGERPLVAVQHANNETGLLQPLDRLAGEVRARGGLLVADCAQTAGKLPLPDADLIALSAHKFGGPPGVGALLVRDLAMIAPVGGQEQGYRTGTENLPGILAMAAALEAGAAWMERAAALRARLDGALAAAGAEIVAAGHPRIATIGAYRMPGVAAAAQMIRFDLVGIAVSAGSACSSGSLKPSRVLAALGLDEGAAGEVVRVSFGRSTSRAEVDRFAALWAEIAARRRAA
ncbi:MAG TPA: aminotransferase class V-fold PLP-dependent enzyme [Allosphingosinicella sp.]|nr:aminotransferase class V-fold PLP-dependent enzyme [Allosphingosinicella sp.]